MMKIPETTRLRSKNVGDGCANETEVEKEGT